MRYKLAPLLISFILLLGCGTVSVGNVKIVEVIPLDATPTPTNTPVPPPTATPVPAQAGQNNQEQAGTAGNNQGGSAPQIETQPPEQEEERGIFGRMFGIINNPTDETLPLHGIGLVFFVPLLLFGIPWVFIEIAIVRYVQPRGLDLSEVMIRAQDGLFIGTTVSMTARRTLSLASTRMTWPRVRGLVEKAIEQELIQRASRFATLDELEQNIVTITDHFRELDIMGELARDFGVQVLRFNIEIRYTPETITALNDRAEASAGGAAYLAYAYAAHLDPDSQAARELYSVYQNTTSQVDAARNLGGGITNLARLLDNNIKPKPEEEDDEADS